MAQGIQKGSTEAKQFLRQTVSPQHTGIERSPYPERAKVAGDLLQNLLDPKELHYFRKVELKHIEKELEQRDAQDRTRTVEAREHKAEAMLNAFKSSQGKNSRRWIKNAFTSLGHVKEVFQGMVPADIRLIKNPFLKSLASLACGYGSKKDGAAAFASQVLRNPSYLFADLRQAKLFLSRFLRQNGLGSLSSMIRRRGQRAQHKVMEKLEGYSRTFKRFVEGLSTGKPRQKVFSSSLATAKAKGAEITKPIPEMAKPSQPEKEPKIMDHSGLVDPARETILPVPSPVIQLSSNIPSPPPPPLRKRDLKQADHPAQNPAQAKVLSGNPGISNGQPLSANRASKIPPPPPLPPPGAAVPQSKSIGSKPTVAAEAIKTLNDLVPVKPADNAGKESIGKCKIAPQDIHKVSESVFQSLSIDTIKAFSPEHIASLTEEQQKAIPVGVISLVVARAMDISGGLTPEQREDRNLALKTLVCLDPKLVREKLENSHDPAHKLYIQPKVVQGKPTDDLSNLYKSIRREVFRLPYQPGEALSRMTPEQLAASQTQQEAGNKPNTQSLLEQIHAGKELKKTGLSQQAPGRASSASALDGDRPEVKTPTIGGGGVFNENLLNKFINKDSHSPQPSSQTMVEVPEADASEWEDDVTEAEDDPRIHTQNKPQDTSPQNIHQAGLDNIQDVPGGTNSKGGFKAETPELAIKPEEAIAEAATQAVQISYKMSEIQKNVGVLAAVQQAVEGMIRMRQNEKMPELSAAEHKALSQDLEGIALGFYREKQKEWMQVAQTAAWKAAQEAAAKALGLGKSQEKVQATAQKAAQAAAEKAVIASVCKAVEDHSNAKISALIKQNTLGNRRRFMEDEDETDEDWDD